MDPLFAAPAIAMADLNNQYQKIRPGIQDAIDQVLRSGSFINGPEVKIFQESLAAFTGGRHVIPCANGTDALQIALMALDLQPGDEVILPAFTYVATAEVAALLQLKPVFADVDPETFNLDPAQAENAITSRTKGMVPVHLFGQCADMEKLQQLAGKQNLAVVEDNAQAIGSVYTFSDGTQKQAGTIGTIGTTSFFPSKNLGCYGDGGALFTNDDALAQKLQMIANHGQSRKYYHDVIGVNSRLDTLQAAILNVKLPHLNAYTEARQQAAAFYDEAFSEIPELKIPARNPNSTHVFHQYTLKVADGRRDALQTFLKEKGIPSMIYYPVPLHLQEAYKYLRYKAGDFPVAEALCQKVISLPMHTELTIDQLSYIAENVRSFFR